MEERGSTWNIWDLHVHTPYSIVHDYKTKEGKDVWETYVSDLECLPKDIKVIGINDYLFLDGYRKVLEYKNQGRLQNINLILPVIEFRMAKFGGNKQFKRINFHVIFSNELTADLIQSQFLNALTSKYKLDPDSHIDTWGGVITKENLQLLGRKIKASIPEKEMCNYGSDLEEGFNNLNLEYPDFIEALENADTFFNHKYVTAIGKTEWDEFKWNDNSIAEKKTLINSVDFVFTASESIEKYNSALQALRNQKVNSRLLDCSDSHRNSWSDNKDRLGNCKTWIKAKTTFEGLKQILYEFDSRVKIKDFKPEEKSAYYVIDSIKFDNPKFCNQEIYFNQNLNAIIGGRSTGKSTLLELLNAKVKNDSSNAYINKFLDTVTVNWRDSEKSSSSDIDYFRQGYMHDLAENRTELDLLVREIVKSRENGFELINYEKDCSTSSVDLIADTTRLFSVRVEATQKEKEIREKGNSLSVQKEISILEEKILEMSSSTFSEEDLNKFEELCNQLVCLENNSSKSHEYEQLCEQCKSISFISNTITYELEKILSDPQNIDLKTKFDIFKLEIEAKWFSLLQEFQINFIEKRKVFSAQIEQIKGSELFKNGTDYQIKNKSYSELKERINREKSKLNSVIDSEKELNRLNEQITSLSCKIVNDHFSLIDKGLQLTQNLKLNSKELKISAKLILQKEELENFLSSRINQQAAQNKDYVKNFCSKYEKEQNQSDKSFTLDFLNRLLNRTIPIKNGNEYQNVATEFLSRCWYTITYSITYQKDKFEEMSPGKQAFVVLKLLLDFSKKKCPILIDQPEDSLDNRAIFKELVEYIRQTKIDRQIIVVTHNANIVVGSDAEEIIVANQQGKNSPNINSVKFQYLTGALEDTIEKHEADCMLNTQGIREHVCEILEGGKDAFEKREQKYGFN